MCTVFCYCRSGREAWRLWKEFLLEKEKVNQHRMNNAKWQTLENGEKIQIIEEVDTINEKAQNPKNDFVKTGFTLINRENYYFVTNNNNTKYYNKEGKLCNI